jgi:hypothetical protein
MPAAKGSERTPLGPTKLFLFSVHYQIIIIIIKPFVHLVKTLSKFALSICLSADIKYIVIVISLSQQPLNFLVSKSLGLGISQIFQSQKVSVSTSFVF